MSDLGCRNSKKKCGHSKGLLGQKGVISGDFTVKKCLFRSFSVFFCEIFAEPPCTVFRFQCTRSFCGKDTLSSLKMAE